jgi:hypothetical protein
MLWLVLSFLPFIAVQRWLHRELYLLFLLLTRRPKLAYGLFSLVFLPGVFLHELSHFITARLLRVETGKFSLLPEVLPDGHLRLGYVETAQTNFLKDSLIGGAPLISGLAIVSFIAVSPLNLLPLALDISQRNWTPALQKSLFVPQQPDFWLWFYLAFAFSSSMLPSPSDRRGWLPLSILLVTLTLIALLVGIGPWLLNNVWPWFDQFLSGLAAIFALSLILHVILAIPVSILRHLITRFFPPLYLS